MSKPKLDWNKFRTTLKGNFNNKELSILYAIYKDGGITEKDLNKYEFLKSKLVRGTSSTKPKKSDEKPSTTQLKLKGLGEVSSDVLFTIASNLPTKEIIRLCETNKYYNKILCKQPNSLFWQEIYEREFGRKYEKLPTPFDMIKDDYILRQQNPRLLEFIKNYTNYDDYKLYKQKEIYDNVKILFGIITRKWFGGIPPTRKNTTLTQADYVGHRQPGRGRPESLGSYITALLVFMTSQYGSDAGMYIMTQIQFNVERNLLDGFIIDDIRIKEELWDQRDQYLYDVIDVINDMYGTNYQWIDT